MPKRISWIDVAKGFTILLVVLGHVTIGLFDSNRYTGISQTSLLIGVQSLYVFHMPVFFALSGYFFTPTSSLSAFLTFTKKKFIALGIPYLVFSFMLVLLFQVGGSRTRTSYSWLDFVNIWQQPIGPAWFLYILFLISIVNSFVSLLIKDIRVHLILATILAIIANIAPFTTYAIQGVFMWAPFFLLGAFLRQSPLKGRWQSLVALVSIYIVYLIIWTLNSPTARVSYHTPQWDALIMVVSILIAFIAFPKIDAFASKLVNSFDRIGQNSMGIYLLHVPLVSGTRMFLIALGINNLGLHIIFGFIVGWYGSLFIIKYVTPLNYVLYPLNYIQTKKKVS